MVLKTELVSKIILKFGFQLNNNYPNNSKFQL